MWSFSTGSYWSPLEMSFSGLVCGCHPTEIMEILSVLTGVIMAPGKLSCSLCVEIHETQLSLHLANDFGVSTSDHLLWDSLAPHGGFLLADTLRYSLTLLQHPMTTSESPSWPLEVMGTKGCPVSGSLMLSTPPCHHFWFRLTYWYRASQITLSFLIPRSWGQKN